MASEAAHAHAAGWLLKHGPGELELLFRAIVFQPSVPIFITDNDGNYHDATAVDTVYRWRYRPATLNGIEVPVVMTVTVNFKLPR